MTTQSEAREAIYAAYKTGWGSTTNYYFDNEVVDHNDLEWTRLVVRHNLGDQETLGPVNGRKFLRGGSVIVQVFVPLDKAMSRGDELSTLVRSIFEGKTISNIRFTGVTIREIGPDSKWYQINVEAPFRYNETK